MFDLQGLIYGDSKKTVRQIKKSVTKRIDKTVTFQDKNQTINLIQSTNNINVVITDDESIAKEANQKNISTVLFTDRIPAPRSGYWFKLFDCITLQKNNTYDFDGVFHSISDFTPPYRVTVINKKDKEWSSNYNEVSLTYGLHHHTAVVSNSIPEWVVTGNDLELVVGDKNNNVVLSGRIGNDNREIFYSQYSKLWSMNSNYFDSFREYQKWVRSTDFDTVALLLDHNNGIPII